jgi:hypothetical protein
MEVDIQDYENQLTVETFAVSPYTWTKGLGQFTIPLAIVNNLTQEFYWLTTKLVNSDTNAQQPIYIDDNHEARLTLQVLPAFFDTANQANIFATTNGIIDAGTL